MTDEATGTTEVEREHHEAFRAFLAAGLAYRANPAPETETAARVARERWEASCTALHAAQVARGNRYNV